MVKEPLLLKLPTELVGKHVTLRAYTDAHAQRLRACIAASHDHLAPWMPWVNTWQKDPLEQERYVRKMQAQWIKREDFVFGIWENASQSLAGACGLHEPDWQTPKFMIGYWLSPQAQGKGYAAEATRLLTQFGFEHLQASRLYITCDAANVRSAAVPPRAGFTQEAYLRSERRDVQGQLSDTLMFGITRADYTELNRAT